MEKAKRIEIDVRTKQNQKNPKMKTDLSKDLVKNNNFFHLVSLLNDYDNPKRKAIK
jgi:hypothetical protein